MIKRMIVIAIGTTVFTPVAFAEWAGSYAGLQAGYNWGDADTSSYWDDGSKAFSIDGFDVDGFTGGIFAGHSWRVGDGIILGIEGEMNAVSADDDIKADAGGGNYYGAEVEQDWDASLRLKAGMDMGDYMPYITGGFAWAGVETTGWTSWGYRDKNEETLTGWTLGAGVEMKIDENLHVQVQYRYSDYGDAKWTLDEPNDPEKGKIEYTGNMLTVGMSYRF